MITVLAHTTITNVLLWCKRIWSFDTTVKSHVKRSKTALEHIRDQGKINLQWKEVWVLIQASCGLYWVVQASLYAIFSLEFLRRRSQEVNLALVKMKKDSLIQCHLYFLCALWTIFMLWLYRPYSTNRVMMIPNPYTMLQVALPASSAWLLLSNPSCGSAIPHRFWPNPANPFQLWYWELSLDEKDTPRVNTYLYW